MPKFKFKSKKRKNKFNLIVDDGEVFNSDILGSSQIQLFSNQKMIVEGCTNILDYQNDYIKLKLKKGFILIMGNNFLIISFEDNVITINGDIVSIEFTV